MASKREPYITNPVTGETATAAFVRYFLSNYASLYDRMTGGTSSLDHVYMTGSGRDPSKRYIGRATPVPNAGNADESLWCARVDILSACRKLPLHQRLVVASIALHSLTEHEAGRRIGWSGKEVMRTFGMAVRRIAAILDGKP